MPKPTENTNAIKIEISLKTLLIVLALAAAVLLLIAIRNVVVIVLLAFIISSALSPIIDKISSGRISRGVAIALTYLLFAVVFLAMVTIISFPLIRESIRFTEGVQAIAENITEWINNLGERLGIGNYIINEEMIQNNLSSWSDEFTRNLGNILSAGISGVIGLFGGIATFVTIITISIYLTLELDTLKATCFNRVSNSMTRKHVKKMFDDIQNELGKWLRGQAILSLSVGFMVWLVLTILRVPYALPLAVLAGMLEIIPVFGPTISAIPAILIVLVNGTWFQKIGVPLGYILLQQFENQILVPRVMSNVMGIPKTIILITFLVGGQLYGVMGVILAVPIVALIHIGTNFYLSTFHKQMKNSKG